MGKMNFTDVISLRTLQKIQDNFSDATGISLSVRDLDNQLITRISNKTKLWSFIEMNPTFKAQWSEQNFQAWEKCIKSGEVVVYERRAGAYTFTVPINVQGKVMAFFVGGLVRLGNANMDVCKKEAELLGISLDEFLDLFLQLPLVSKNKLEAAGNLLRIIANTISGLEIEGNMAKAEIQAMNEHREVLEKEIEDKVRSMRQLETKCSRLFNLIYDGVCMTDMDGKYIDINTAGAKMLGYTNPNEIIGQYARNYYVDPQERQLFLDKISREGHIENFYALLNTKDGKRRWFETSAIIVRDHLGKNIGIQGIFRDVTDRKHQGIIQNESSQLSHYVAQPKSITDPSHQ